MNRNCGLSFGVLAALSISMLLSAATKARAVEPSTQPAAKIRIVLAGDSTTAVGSGWGPGFMKCLADNVECVNLARGGRSSKSFIAEGLWQKSLDLKPDFILIQFGHNDQPGHGADRETDPQTTYRQFMTRYVDEARAAGIKPVLITPMSRRQWGADGKIHSTLTPNAEVVKEVAAEKHVPLLDLHARSIDLYEKLGRAGCNEFSPIKEATTKPKAPATELPPSAVAENANAAPEKGKVYDGTHLNAKGAAIIGPIVAEELARIVPELAASIKLPPAP